MLPSCAPTACEIIRDSIWRADPLLRYRHRRLEITSWAHDWGELTIRWAVTKTPLDHFSSFTPPHRVREGE
jgi:hypothetical protein